MSYYQENDLNSSFYDDFEHPRGLGNNLGCRHLRIIATRHIPSAHYITKMLSTISKIHWKFMNIHFLIQSLIEISFFAAHAKLKLLTEKPWLSIWFFLLLCCFSIAFCSYCSNLSARISISAIFDFFETNQNRQNTNSNYFTF